MGGKSTYLAGPYPSEGCVWSGPDLEVDSVQGVYVRGDF